MPHCNKKMISFFLTTKCNLCCRYCYNANERNTIQEHSIPLKIAKAGIDWYFKTNLSRHIRFYGPGEPTQEFEKMKEITEYARTHKHSNNAVTVELQTNGVFTDEIRDWILDNVNIVWMSFDGTKDIQEYNRPINPKYINNYNKRTSGEVLENNVRWLIKNKGKRNLMVGARVTITNTNVNKQLEMLDYFYGLGIKHVWTDPVFFSVGKNPVNEDKKKKSEYSFDMDLYIKSYLEAYYYAKEKGMFWGSFLTINFDGETSYHCRACTPLNAPHFTPDGYISACDMVVLGEKAYHMDPFIIGKWNSFSESFEFDDKKIAILNKRQSTNMNHCKSCPVKLHCGGYCLGETLNETGKLTGRNIVKCRAIQKLYKEIGVCDAYEYLHP